MLISTQHRGYTEKMLSTSKRSRHNIATHVCLYGNFNLTVQIIILIRVGWRGKEGGKQREGERRKGGEGKEEGEREVGIVHVPATF